MVGKLTTEDALYQQLIIKAREIGELAEKEALEAEKNASISQNVVDAIVEAGINRLIIPEEYGYPQIDFKTFADVVKKVGYYNLSAAWLTYFYALHNSWVAYLPKHRMDEIYEDGGLIADIFAPIGRVQKVDGGYVLNGKWNFVSGINYAEWVSVGALYFEEGKTAPKRLGMCMRTSELELIKDWDPVGLRGSGSNSVVATEVFVPEDMVIYLDDMAIHGVPQAEGLAESYLYYNRPFFPAFYVGFPAMCIGAAERAIEEFIARTKKRVRMDGSNEGESPKSQRVAAEMTLQLKAAKGLMQEYIDMLEVDHGQFNLGVYNGIRVTIVKTCVEIALRATLTLGASALAKGTPLEIILRDLIAVGTHLTSLYEDGIDNLGKALFDVKSFALG